MVRFVEHEIRPEAVEVGCTIRCDFQQDKGLRISYAGRVHSIRYRGNTRQFVTQEGRVVCSWDPTSKPLYKLSLLARDPEPQTALDLGAW